MLRSRLGAIGRGQRSSDDRVAVDSAHTPPGAPGLLAPIEIGRFVYKLPIAFRYAMQRGDADADRTKYLGWSLRQSRV